MSENASIKPPALPVTTDVHEAPLLELLPGIYCLVTPVTRCEETKARRQSSLIGIKAQLL